MAVFKVEAQRARLDAENAERDARVLAGRLEWLEQKVDEYDDLDAISGTEVETFHQFLEWVKEGSQ